MGHSAASETGRLWEKEIRPIFPFFTHLLLEYSRPQSGSMYAELREEGRGPNQDKESSASFNFRPFPLSLRPLLLSLFLSSTLAHPLPTKKQLPTMAAVKGAIWSAL